MFPEYQTKSSKFRFDKYTTIRKLYEEAYKQKIDENFTKANQEEFQKYIFVFRIHHDKQEWNLYKTFSELYNFQHSLIKKYKSIPRFPLEKDQEKNLKPQVLTPLVTFLEILIKAIYQNALTDPIVISFLNLFPQNLGHGIIYGEFPMYKRSGGRYNETSCCKQFYHCMIPCVRSWKLRYFTVTDNGILYTSKSKSFEIKDMLLFCFKFTIHYGLFKTGRQLGLVIQSSTRRLKIQSDTLFNLILLIIAIKEALDNSPFAEDKKVKFEKYGSFAPIRNKCSSKFYADGKQYFEDLYEQLKKAKKYVYITGWMITPYFVLKRPNPLKNKEYRLDGVLEQLANKGVKIYVIVYQQPKIAVNNDSQFVEKYLESLGSNNIKVMRHPNYLVIPFLWSHHEKIVLIDQRVAFIGGLDICYGRWDTHKHEIINHHSRPLWEGADYCNLRTRDIYKPRDYMLSNLSDGEPKMPWHDIAIQIRGGSVQDIARHFTNYWNFVNFQTRIDNDRELLNLAGIKHGQARASKFATAKQFFKKFKFRRNTGKVEPIVEMNQPSSPLTRKLSKITDTHRDSMMSGRSSRPKDEVQDEFYENFIKNQEEKQNFITDKLLKFPIKIFEKLKEAQPQEQCLLVTNQTWKQVGMHQHLILRSSSTWSGGLSSVESSIHEAYLDLIRNSKRFIYIENQFFIARQNQVIEQIAKRILLAHRNKQKFKIMVFIPLLPGFEGDVRQSNSAVMRIQLHLQYETICRSTNSLFSKLQNGKMKQQEIQNYIKFFSLRQHGLMADIPVTQILYIHSKLMIVDDEKMIIGSANINDRSLLGDRDSQIAILVQDDIKKESQKNTKTEKEQYPFSKDIRQFRKSLIQEHFHVDLQMAQKFYTEDNWSWLKTIAKRNTQIYSYVFGCYPDDKMRKFKDIEQIQVTSPLEKIKRYAEDKSHIKGHAVQLPLHFLEQENLEIHITQKEIILPDFFFT